MSSTTATDHKNIKTIAQRRIKIYIYKKLESHEKI